MNLSPLQTTRPQKRTYSEIDTSFSYVISPPLPLTPPPRVNKSPKNNNYSSSSYYSSSYSPTNSPSNYSNYCSLCNMFNHTLNKCTQLCCNIRCIGIEHHKICDCTRNFESSIYLSPLSMIYLNKQKFTKKEISLIINGDIFCSNSTNPKYSGRDVSFLEKQIQHHEESIKDKNYIIKKQDDKIDDMSYQLRQTLEDLQKIKDNTDRFTRQKIYLEEEISKSRDYAVSLQRKLKNAEYQFELMENKIKDSESSNSKNEKRFKEQNNIVMKQLIEKNKKITELNKQLNDKSNSIHQMNNQLIDEINLRQKNEEELSNKIKSLEIKLLLFSDTPYFDTSVSPQNTVVETSTEEDSPISKSNDSEKSILIKIIEEISNETRV